LLGTFLTLLILSKKGMFKLLLSKKWQKISWRSLMTLELG